MAKHLTAYRRCRAAVCYAFMRRACRALLRATARLFRERHLRTARRAW